MLVLSRKKGESIIIGNDIEIILVDIRGKRVRFGVNAPTNITVHRKEIYQAMQEKTYKNG